MLTVDQARALALRLPAATEQDHHGNPSFRVGGKIFATLPPGGCLRIMAAEGEILAAVAEEPGACREFWWGARLACVEVDLGAAGPELVGELLVDAWRRRAPRRLVRAFDADPPAAEG